MKEVKTSKKPLIFYYLIVLGIILLFNVVIAPLLSSQKIVDVDYGTFVRMAEDKQLGLVEVDESGNQVLFTDKE